MRDGHLRGELSPQATQRQMDVLAAYVTAGGSVRDAAEFVGIRPSTVKRHCETDLRARSGLTTEQLIYRGRAEGWLSVPSLEPGGGVGPTKGSAPGPTDGCCRRAPQCFQIARIDPMVIVVVCRTTRRRHVQRLCSQRRQLFCRFSPLRRSPQAARDRRRARAHAGPSARDVGPEPAFVEGDPGRLRAVLRPDLLYGRREVVPDGALGQRQPFGDIGDGG